MNTMYDPWLGKRLHRKQLFVPESKDDYYAHLIYSTELLTLVGLCQEVINAHASNNKTILLMHL